MFRISQGQLNMLEFCPRKFQYTYLDNLNTLTDLEHWESLNWGSRFHLLMQQRELGLPIDLLLTQEPRFKIWLDSLIKAAGDLFKESIDPDSFRESEHQRSLWIGDYQITVIYDLLILNETQGKILDWKTHLSFPKSPQKLKQNWQTRLYLYVLKETCELKPEQLSMTYWFVQAQPQANSISVTYDQLQHQANHQDLMQLLNNLTTWLELYQSKIPFPQIPASSSLCSSCSFAINCQRGSYQHDDDQINLLDLDQIPEIRWE